MDTLTKDTLLHMAGYLETDDIRRLSRSCKSLYSSEPLQTMIKQRLTPVSDSDPELFSITNAEYDTFAFRDGNMRWVRDKVVFHIGYDYQAGDYRTIIGIDVLHFLATGNNISSEFDWSLCEDW